MKNKTKKLILAGLCMGALATSTLVAYLNSRKEK